ncbi:dioxygenase family protein [Paractinoplanes brasiliensis]|uniref:Protocatechuate 3,4-dioxygenase beta subunit n=1 Tax=Paractinoplanes brasiliensis TaxID=52695 RepID=A0A4R6JQZ9_9ACTN|nr:cupin domain-containing protein [Actinoplanes brasiliensis]TDO37065.1 protocatechuate 3,4-dioxygenase beta subunit [Actinoplanes brasiliensis]GID32241.1 hypothetical protein Abr02nite_72240 [Actinoplanes brasiliensis]
MLETDPLSEALTTYGGRCGISGGFTAGEGPWAVRFRGGRQLPVIVRGPGWLLADGAAPERLENEGLTLPSGRVPFVLASDPGVEPRDADQLLHSRPGLIVPLGGEQMVGLIRQAGSGPDERLLDALPPVVRVRDAPAVRYPIDRIVHELSRRAPGFAHITEQYAQALMADVLRSVLDSRDLADAGWLRLYADAELWPALALIHDQPAESAHRHGSPLGLLGPFYLPGAPRLEPPNVMPRRPDEKGETLIFRGAVHSTTGEPLPAAEFDMWQADADGNYSGMVPGIPPWNLRGRFGAAADGTFEVTTIQPAPYPVPGDGPIGSVLRELGRHLYRPAHLHLQVTAPDHEVLTIQLYFADGDYLASDAANAVRDGLIVPVELTGDVRIATYDFVLEPLLTE